MQNVRATRCAPCRRKLPELDALRRDLGGPDFEVVPLATGRNARPAILWLFPGIGTSALPILPYPNQPVARDMGVPCLPITLILNPQGQEIARLTGGQTGTATARGRSTPPAWRPATAERIPTTQGRQGAAPHEFGFPNFANPFLVCQRRAFRSGAKGMSGIAGITLDEVTGTVTGVGGHSETLISGHGSGIPGGTASVDIRSETVKHLSFFLRRPDGVDEPVRMWGFDIPLAEGQAVTLIRASRGKSHRHAVLINHNARQFWPLYQDPAQVAEAVNAVMPVKPGLFLAAILGAAGGWLLNEIVFSNVERLPLWQLSGGVFLAIALIGLVRRRFLSFRLGRALRGRAGQVLADFAPTKSPK